MNTIELTVEGKVRQDILMAALSAGKNGAHIAPSLSMAEIALSVLRKKRTDDKIILSKGHGALGLYAAMHQSNVISDEQFASFEMNGSEFPGQPSRSPLNRLDYSSGSLGMGLSYAAGLSYADHRANIFVILGDGELNEGSVWEAAGIVKRYNLVNVTAIVDHNGLQSDGKINEVVGTDLTAIWKAYGWNVKECDGHSTAELEESIDEAIGNGLPTAIIAKTVKGKGVSFMEGNNEWHHHELKQEEYDIAMAEIGELYGLH